MEDLHQGVGTHLRGQHPLLQLPCKQSRHQRQEDGTNVHAAESAAAASCTQTEGQYSTQKQEVLVDLHVSGSSYC